jgi:hypothetical protein
VSLAPNSRLIGSIITAMICRPTKLSAYIIASRSKRPWLRHGDTGAGVSMALVVMLRRVPSASLAPG